jgi:hypothetical protein
LKNLAGLSSRPFQTRPESSGFFARDVSLLRGRQISLEIYQAPAAKIDLIPHGIPDMPFAVLPLDQILAAME